MLRASSACSGAIAIKPLRIALRARSSEQRLDHFGHREQHHHHRRFGPLADASTAPVTAMAHQGVDIEIEVAQCDQAPFCRFRDRWQADCDHPRWQYHRPRRHVSCAGAKSRRESRQRRPSQGPTPSRLMPDSAPCSCASSPTWSWPLSGMIGCREPAVGVSQAARRACRQWLRVKAPACGSRFGFLRHVLGVGIDRKPCAASRLNSQPDGRLRQLAQAGRRISGFPRWGNPSFSIRYSARTSDRPD